MIPTDNQGVLLLEQEGAVKPLVGGDTILGSTEHKIQLIQEHIKLDVVVEQTMNNEAQP